MATSNCPTRRSERVREGIAPVRLASGTNETLASRPCQGLVNTDAREMGGAARLICLVTAQVVTESFVATDA